MPTVSASQKFVLFVDDDTEFLELLQAQMEHQSGGTWAVLTASDPGTALTTLGAHHADLVVLDVRMPVMDGVQLLQLLNRKHPQLKKAVLSGHVDAEVRAMAFQGGAELVLEKPRESGGYAALFMALNELLLLPTEQGFRGTLRRVGLEDIIQMECLSRHSLILEVAARGRRGTIYIRDGSLVHAGFGEMTGEPALQEILMLTGGEFHHRPFTEPPRETLEGSWEFLLMEAVRRRDERAGEGVPEDVETVLAPIVAEVRTPVVIHDEPVVDDAPVINELVVCSEQGEPLYVAQSANPRERCEWCVVIMEGGALLQTLLPVGVLERVEFLSVSGRMVARIQDGQGVFLRANDV